MKRIAFYLSLVLVVLVLASCKKGQKNLFTPTSSGRPYEVLVVVNKPVWDRPAGRALFDVLDTNVPGTTPGGAFVSYIKCGPSAF